MKNSDIKVGKKYMLSLGRGGAVAVTVERWNRVRDEFICRDSRGVEHEASARRLSPCPVTDRDGELLGYAHEM